MAQKEIFEVVWPRGRRVVEGARYARRLDTLDGKTICELWDWLFDGDKVFSLIEKELANRYPGIEFVTYKEFGSVHGADEANVLAALPGKFKSKKCDAVISSMGC